MDTSWLIQRKRAIAFYGALAGGLLLASWLLIHVLEKAVPAIVIKKVAALEHTIQTEIQAYISHEKESIKNNLEAHPEMVKQFRMLSDQLSSHERNTSIQAMQSQLNAVKNKYVFVNQKGMITFSQIDAIKTGTSIRTYNELGTLFENAEIVLQPLASSFISFEQTKEKPAMYLAFPCLSDHEFIGILLVQLNEDMVPTILKKHEAARKSIFLAQGYGHRVKIIFGSNIPEEQKKEGISVHITEPITLALQGDTGHDITTTPRGRKLANARYYDIATGWALAVQQDMSFFFAFVHAFKKILLCMTILMMLCAIVLGIFIRKSLYHWLSEQFNYILFYTGIFILCASLAVLGYLIITHRQIKENDFNQIQNDYHSKFDRASSVIAQDLNKLHYFVRALSLDFSLGKITLADLIKLMDEYVIKYPFIEGAIIVNDPAAHHGEKKSITFIDTHQKVTNQRENLEDYAEAPWYKKTIEDGSYWSAPQNIQGLKKPVIAYAETFIDIKTKKPLGVIAFLYPYQSLLEVASSIGIQKEEKTYIINSSGYFIYHNDLEYLVDKLTIYDLVHTVSPKILEAYKKGLTGSSGTVEMEEGGKKEVVFYDSIPVSNWVMLSIFDQEEFQSFSLELYHNIIYILLIVLSSIFALLLLRVIQKNYDLATIVKTNTAFSGALLTGLVFILLLANSYLGTRYDGSIIEGKMDVDIVMQEEKKPDSLLATKTGIFINYLEMGSKVTVAAHTWQDHPDSEFEGENVVYKEASGVLFKNRLEKQETDKVGKTSQEGWDTIGSLYMHKQSVFWFPFDAPLVEIVLTPEKQEEDYFLYPDFEAYKNLRPASLPGINADINLKDFIFKKSFFSYKPSNYKEFYEENRSDLVFNIVLGRNLINMFLIHIFPFVVILFALFVLLLVQEKDKMSLLSGYIALLFSLILVHQSFRTIAQVTEIVYLEYLYSIGYALLIMALIDTIFAFKNQTYNKLRQVIFFDALAILMFCATLFAFYNLA